MGLDDLEQVLVTSRAQWREWLAANADTSPGIWLVMPRRDSDDPAPTYDDVVEEALCFGWIDSTIRTRDERFGLQLLTPRKPTSTWSASDKERLSRLIPAGLVTDRGLRAVEAAKGNGSPGRSLTRSSVWRYPMIWARHSTRSRLRASSSTGCPRERASSTYGSSSARNDWTPEPPGSRRSWQRPRKAVARLADHPPSVHRTGAAQADLLPFRRSAPTTDTPRLRPTAPARDPLPLLRSAPIRLGADRRGGSGFRAGRPDHGGASRGARLGAVVRASSAADT